MKTINIIGRGRGKTNGLNADGEKFTCNYHTPGVDVMFDMHPITGSDIQKRQHDLCKQAGIQIIGLAEYPINEIETKFKTKFFGNAIAYMIAYALHHGYEKIRLWGCQIKPGKDDEPIVKNHPGVEFWLGYAMGLGIEVEVNGDTMIFELEKGRYGYDW